MLSMMINHHGTRVVVSEGDVIIRASEPKNEWAKRDPGTGSIVDGIVREAVLQFIQTLDEATVPAARARATAF